MFFVQPQCQKKPKFKLTSYRVFSKTSRMQLEKTDSFKKTSEIYPAPASPVYYSIQNTNPENANTEYLPADFLFDGYVRELRQANIIDENGQWSAKQYPPCIDSDWKTYIWYLNALLDRPFFLNIVVESNPPLTTHIEVALRKLLLILGKKWRIIGEEAKRVLFDSLIKMVQPWLFKPSHSEEPEKKCKLNLLGMFPKGTDLEEVAEKLIKYFAGRIRSSDDLQLRDEIRKKGGVFRRFDPIFSIDSTGKNESLCVNKDKSTYVFVISFEADIGGIKTIDLTLAIEDTEDSSSEASYALNSVQKLSLDIQSLLEDNVNKEIFLLSTPEETVQAAIDVYCKTVSICKSNHQAWIRWIAQSVEGDRCPFTFPQLLENLQKFCESAWGKTPKNILLDLLKGKIDPHASNSYASVALTFNACASLQEHEYFIPFLRYLWNQMPIPPKKMFRKSFLFDLHQAACVLKFDVISAVFEAYGALVLAEKKEGNPIVSGSVFLTQFNRHPALLAYLDGVFLTCPFHIENALKKISSIYTELMEGKETEQLNALINLLETWSPPFAFEQEDASPLKVYAKNLNIDLIALKSLHQTALDLMKLPHPVLKELGYRFSFLCYTLHPKPELSWLARLVLFFPCAFSNIDAEGNKNLIHFLDNAVRQRIASLKKENKQTLSLMMQHFILPDPNTIGLELRRWHCRVAELKSEFMCAMARNSWKEIKEAHSEELTLRFIKAQTIKKSQEIFELIQNDISPLSAVSTNHIICLNIYLNLISKQDANIDFIKQIVTFLTDISTKEILDKEALAQFYKRFVFLLIRKQMRPEAVYLVLEALKKRSLAINTTTYEMVMALCYASFLAKAKPKPDFSEMLPLWKQASEDQLWKEQELRPEYQKFLVALCKYLYIENSIEQDILAESTMELLYSQPLSEPTLSRETIQFCMEMRNQRNAFLKKNVKSELNRILRRMKHRQEHQTLKKDIPFTIHAICYQALGKIEKLNYLFQLFSSPLINCIWEGEEKKSFALICKSIKTTLHRKMPLDEFKKVFKLLQCAFTQIEYQDDAAILDYVSLWIEAFVENGEIHFESFSAHMRKNLSKIFDTLHKHNKEFEIAKFLNLLLKHFKDFQLSPAIFSTFIYPHVDLDKQKIDSSSFSLYKEYAHLIENIRFDLDDDQNSEEELTKFAEECDQIATILNKKHWREPTSKWVSLIETLNAVPQLQGNTDIPQSLFKWAEVFYREERHPLAKDLLENLEKRYGGSSIPIKKNAADFHNDFLQVCPTFFSKILFEEDARISKELKIKIDRIVRLLLLEANWDSAMNLLKRYPMCMKITLQDVFAQVEATDGTIYLKQCWKIYKQRRKQTSEPFDEKAVKCWRGATKVLTMCCSREREIGYSWNELDKQTDLLLDIHSELRQGIINFTKASQDNPLQEFLERCLHAIPSGNKSHFDLLEKLLALFSLLLPKNGEKLRNIDKLWIEHLAASKNIEFFKKSLEIFHDWLNAQQIDLPLALQLFQQFVHYTSFDNEVAFMMEKIIDSVKSLSPEAKEQAEKILSQHPNVKKIDDIFLALGRMPFSCSLSKKACSILFRYYGRRFSRAISSETTASNLFYSLSNEYQHFLMGYRYRLRMGFTVIFSTLLFSILLYAVIMHSFYERAEHK